jgi:hypothetical protein
MERYIKNNLDDITYLSELTPAALQRKAKQRGLIRTHNLLRLASRKLCAH